MQYVSVMEFSFRLCFGTRW